jgi:SHS2 domain-containing protein
VTRSAAIEPRAELFAHGADIGVRGIGPTREYAFEQAALALSMAVTDPSWIAPQEAVAIACEAPDDRFLLLDWLNALIYEMSARRRYSAALPSRSRDLDCTARLGASRSIARAMRRRSSPRGRP